MKNKLLKMTWALFGMALFVTAQVPNGDFEEWDEIGNPAHWYTTNVPEFVESITKSDDAHSGDYAVRGEVLEFMEGLNWPPFMIAGDSSGFALDQNYSNLTGYYKFSPQGNDALQIVIIMYSADFYGSGIGQAELPATTDSYQFFTIPISYYSSAPVSYCYIEIFCGDTTDSGDGGTLGTFFLIDDLAFSGITAIGQENEDLTPVGFALQQNYPNPFNPSTVIEFQLPQSSTVSLTIFDIQGREVERLINNQMLSAAKHEVSWDAQNLPSGVYFYRLTAGNYNETKRMMLLK